MKAYQKPMVITNKTLILKTKYEDTVSLQDWHVAEWKNANIKTVIVVDFDQPTKVIARLSEGEVDTMFQDRYTRWIHYPTEDGTTKAFPVLIGEFYPDQG
jgi:hypothetical protein